MRGGIPVVPFTVYEIDDMERTLARGTERERQAVRARLEAVPADMRPSVEPRDTAAPPNPGAATPRESRPFRIDAPSLSATRDDGSPSIAPSGGRTGSPTFEPVPGSEEYRAADAAARGIVAKQDADQRVTDRSISAWIASTNGEPESEMPPELAKRLEPDQRQELEEILEDSVDTETDSAVLTQIIRGFTSYNSQVRLKWAREPLYRLRPYLSAEDFAKVTSLQRKLDPHTGRILGTVPVPDDLQAWYDWLAPAPEAEYGTFVAEGSDGRLRGVMPTSVRSFLKGILDLFAAEKTGEITTDALDSFATLNILGGSVFGPRGGAETLAAGGKRPKLSLQKRIRANSKAGREYEEKLAQHLQKLNYLDVAVQITVKLPNGAKLRLDAIARNKGKRLYVYEAKAGNGRLRRIQRENLEALEKYGGTIVGAGKKHSKGGTEIPPGIKFILQREGNPFHVPSPWAKPPPR
jgi:hypothetical protein